MHRLTNNSSIFIPTPQQLSYLYVPERTNVPRTPCLNSCSESRVGKEEKIGLKWTYRRLWGFVCLFWPWRTFVVCTEQLYTNQPVPLRQTENGAESCMFKSWQATLFTKISLKTVWTFWAARKKGCTKNILFNEWIVGWCQTLIDLDFFVLSKGSLSVARAFRGLKEATHNKHIEANLLACPFSWKQNLAFSFFF